MSEVSQDRKAWRISDELFKETNITKQEDFSLTFAGKTSGRNLGFKTIIGELREDLHRLCDRKRAFIDIVERSST